MMSVTREVQFDAAHRVPLHGGKCRNLHGHRYRVALTLTGAVDELAGEASGMVVDFGAIKTFLAVRVHDRWDHGLIVAASDKPLRTMLTTNSEADGWRVDVLPCTPTAENLAAIIAADAIEWFAASPVTVSEVIVWETPTSSATWRPT